MAGRFLGAVTIDDDDAAVVRRQPEDDARRECAVGGEHRGHEAAATTARQRDGVLDIGVGQQGRHRPEGFDLVHRARARGPAAEQEYRRHEAAAGKRRVARRVLRVARHEGRLGTKLGDAREDFAALLEARQRPHARGG